VPLAIQFRARLRLAFLHPARGQRGRGQDDLVGTVGPGHDLGQAFLAVAAVHSGADDLPTPVANHGPLGAARDLQAAGEHVVLAVAHERSEGPVLEVARGRPGLAERSGFRIREPTFHQEACTLDALQGGQGVVAAQAAGDGIGQPAREQVHLARVAAHRSRRNHLDANGQRGRL
jgi:hypothetical protein